MNRYRNDIDVLRAISVTFVIFFHLKIPFFDGGFIGVDIFFVISGYLITKIILTRIEKGNFSLKNFYLRRVRRIIPLVLIVSLVTSILSSIFFFPHEFKDYVNSLISVNLFFSNFFYQFKGGYFSPILETDPLIHFWSLSVEEQFYLIYPLFFLIFLKKKNFFFFKLFLIFAFILSFTLSQFGGNLMFNYPYFENEFKFTSIPQFAFYSTVTRAWEIIGGCLAALFTHEKKIDFKFKSYFIYLLLFLLFLLFFIFNDVTPHPSYITLLVILLVILILIVNENNQADNLILNSKILSKIGLFSFSLYLWHQPIFVYIKLYNINEISYFYKLFILFFLFIFSFFSWKFVELPFRNSNLITNKILSAFIMVSICLIFFVNYFSFLKNKNFNPNVLNLINQEKNYEKYYFDNCTSVPKKFIEPNDACLIGMKNITPSIAVIGDSHASALASSFNETFNKLNLSALLFTINGCPTSFNLYNYKDRRFECVKFYEKIKKTIENNKNIKTVIIHSRWSFYVSGKRFDNGEGGIEYGNNTKFVRKDNEIFLAEKDSLEIVLNEIETFIKFLSKNKKRVLIISPVPEVGLNVPKSMARVLHLKKSKNFKDYTTSYETYFSRNKNIINLFDKLEKKNFIKKFDSSDVFCIKEIGRCKFAIENNPLYFDDDHLNSIGSRLLVDSFIEDNKVYLNN